MFDQRGTYVHTIFDVYGHSFLAVSRLVMRRVFLIEDRSNTHEWRQCHANLK